MKDPVQIAAKILGRRYRLDRETLRDLQQELRCVAILATEGPTLPRLLTAGRNWVRRVSGYFVRVRLMGAEREYVPVSEFKRAYSMAQFRETSRQHELLDGIVWVNEILARDSDRDLLVEYIIHEESLEELAAKAGVSRETIRRRLAAAKSRLAENAR